ncbi:MAG: recombinase family protein [Bacteroidetes bacterium]|nr:recombinase family protein [Bacteroidota bacterium]
MNKKNLAVGYVRCSTEMQDDSVEQQKKEIQKWADTNGMKVIEWFEDESKSGTSFDKRPAFMRLMQRIETSSGFEYILVYDESRWGRPNNPRENTYWKFHAERYGVKVRVINSGSKNENDIGSFVTEVVESAEASEYSKKLSRSTKRGCIAKETSGYSSGGTAPYGYKRIAVDIASGNFLRDLPDGTYRRKGEEQVTFAPGDLFEVNVVKRIFEMKAKGIGLKSIANALNTENISCPRRGRWKNANQKWSSGTIRSIIQNPAYYGDRVYNRFPKNKLEGKSRGKRNNASEWIVKEQAHEAIITKELFQRANAMNHIGFASGASKAVHGPYLLSGLITCSKCGFKYSGYTRSKKDLRYYADSGYISKGRSVCDWNAIPKEKLENLILEVLENELLNSTIQGRSRSWLPNSTRTGNKGTV